MVLVSTWVIKIQQVYQIPIQAYTDSLPGPGTSAHKPRPTLPEALETCCLWDFSTLLKAFIRNPAINSCVVYPPENTCLQQSYKIL